MSELAFLVVAATLLGSLGFPSFLPYNWHKFLHVIGAVLFVGNIVVTGAWMFLSERTMDFAVLRFSSRVVNWADVAFTAPGVILILLNGLTLANQWGGVFGASWITAGGTLLLVSGLVWVGFLIRYQDKMIRLSEGSQDGQLPSEFFKVLHRWYFWGMIATILPLITVALMVVKPAL